MAHDDLPLEELRRYQPGLPEPADLEGFWAGTLSQARAHSLEAILTPVDNRWPDSLGSRRPGVQASAGCRAQ